MPSWLRQFRREGASSPQAELSGDCQWLVGARYEVSQSVLLFAGPDFTSEAFGHIPRRESVLLMALQFTPSPCSGSKILWAYVANTKKPKWTHGWCPLDIAAPFLRKQILDGSWEMGGRYRVAGSLVLRDSVELDGEKVHDIPHREEVLLLQFGLVVQDAIPRLRAYVRTDAGWLGWITVELPGELPLLEHLNLYSEKAIRGRGHVFWKKQHAAMAQLSGNRFTLSGVLEGSKDVWEVGAQHRVLAKVVLRERADLDSPVICNLKTGTLVYVEEVCHVAWLPGKEGATRLRVLVGSADDPSGSAKRGWISTESVAGKVVLDARDHLEYDKLLGAYVQEDPELDLDLGDLEAKAAEYNEGELFVAAAMEEEVSGKEYLAIPMSSFADKLLPEEYFAIPMSSFADTSLPEDQTKSRIGSLWPLVEKEEKAREGMSLTFADELNWPALRKGAAEVEHSQQQRHGPTLFTSATSALKTGARSQSKLVVMNSDGTVHHTRDAACSKDIITRLPSPADSNLCKAEKWPDIKLYSADVPKFEGAVDLCACRGDGSWIAGTLNAVLDQARRLDLFSGTLPAGRKDMTSSLERLGCGFNI